MGRLVDADICLYKAWQNFYKQEDEHAKNIDGYDIIRDRFYEQSGFECCQQTIVNAPTVEAIPKADYEEQIKINNKLVNDNEQLRAYITMMQADYNARLKADMAAMLTALQLECEEKAIDLCDPGWYLTYNDIIQQKINSLRGEAE